MLPYIIYDRGKLFSFTLLRLVNLLWSGKILVRTLIIATVQVQIYYLLFLRIKQFIWMSQKYYLTCLVRSLLCEVIRLTSEARAVQLLGKLNLFERRAILANFFFSVRVLHFCGKARSLIPSLVVLELWRINFCFHHTFFLYILNIFLY